MIDWENIREQCIRSGKKVRLKKSQVLPLPSFFHETSLGLAKDAIRQYRDNTPANSLHIHEYIDCFTAHIDAFNPEFHPIAHGIVDAPGVTVGIVAGAIACFFLAKTIRDMSFIADGNEQPPW